MMPGINAMIRRAQSIDITDSVQAAVASTVNDYEQLQRLQMLTGKDSKGNLIGKYKNKKYADQKFAMNPLAGRGNMDFRLTGDFFKQFFTRLGTNSVFISSSDKKTDRLLEINSDVFGLNKENSMEYSIHHIKPVGIRVIKKQLTG